MFQRVTREAVFPLIGLLLIVVFVFKADLLLLLPAAQPARAVSTEPTPESARPDEAASATLQEDKAIVRRYLEEVWNKKNLSVLNELIDPNCVSHLNGPVTTRGGPDTSRASLEANWFRAIPDISVTIESMVAEGDTVVARGPMRGTQLSSFTSGPLNGLLPMGRSFFVDQASVYHIADGKIDEIWLYVSFLDIQRQLTGS